MSLRKAPPEAKFTKFINPRHRIDNDTRTKVLLRLDPDLLQCLDARAAQERSNRHDLIIEILSSYLNYAKA